MLRRPPGEGRLVADQRKTKVLLALAAFALPWLPLADAQQQQQQHSVQQEQPRIAARILNGEIPTEDQQVRRQDDEYSEAQRRGRRGSYSEESPFEGHQALNNRPATFSQEIPARKSTLPDFDGRQNAVTTAYGGLLHNHYINHINNNHNDADDASALATVAPDHPVRATNSPRQLTSILADAGLSSPQSARSLERWEVGDFVLLATVDGHLYAVGKETGEERWQVLVEEPAVETIHHRPNNSLLDENNRHPLDEYIWAVEPSLNGPVYVWQPSGFGTGLVDTGLTMKSLVEELGPYAVENPPVVYTGDKKTEMISLDAATGRVLKWFGPSGSQVDSQRATCFRPNSLPDATENQECSNTGIITLSRTHYTVSIQRQDDGRPIATLRFAEWGPNNFDNDLHQQYQANVNTPFITSKHDGTLHVLANSEDVPLEASFSSPVARTFDVARPNDVPWGTNPELVLLPQVAPPPSRHDIRDRRSSVLLNQTEWGSWYAMSGLKYPLVTKAPPAQINNRDKRAWLDLDDTWYFNDAIVNEALVGTHHVKTTNQDVSSSRELAEWQPGVPAGLPSGSQSEITKSRENSTSLVVHEESELTTIVENLKTIPNYAKDRVREFFSNPILFVICFITVFWYINATRAEQLRAAMPARTNLDKSLDAAEPVNEVTSAVADENPPKAEVQHPDVGIQEKVQAPTATIDQSPTDNDGGSGPETQPAAVETQEQEPKKKKTHRGTRGGKAHKKKKKQDFVQPRENQAGSTNGEVYRDEVDQLMSLGTSDSGPQPDTRTLTNGKPQDISEAGFEINGLRVNVDEQLGVGSNGTVVFSGTFHNRDVAVKRMLAIYNDIAYQETQLLLESENHPNVIQYYAFIKDSQEKKTATFLYIALERCRASLADIIEKPHMHRELAREGEKDIPNVLLQIANGLSHLHSLRIVHRDLKPQNILVTMTKDGKPRLVVSDFGLCKKLDMAQSSFGATTAHAAGTSGWRAPELLLDDDARENSTSMTSTHSDSSLLVSPELMPNRRSATRAIDIFSLGLVFFYVLTKGCHPFDCGDRYMREVNIRKGQLNLAPLDMLGDFAYEAKDLIEGMLDSEPRARPSIADVMSHPFFWTPKKRLSFLCDVSDHFEKEQRDPPSCALVVLESHARDICRGDFLKELTRDFVESLGKQRKYTGSRLLDLLRALRNKFYHREDFTDALKKTVGITYEDYLGYWTRRFPNLLVTCYVVVGREVELQDTPRFKEYFEPMRP